MKDSYRSMSSGVLRIAIFEAVDDVRLLSLQADKHHHRHILSDGLRIHDRHVRFDDAFYAKSLESPLHCGGGQANTLTESLARSPVVLLHFCKEAGIDPIQFHICKKAALHHHNRGYQIA